MRNSIGVDKGYKYIVGIDEVGRGPIAGPVAVCAFVIKNEAFNNKQKDLPPLRDSKKLTKIQRDKWYKYIKDSKGLSLCDYAVSFVSSEMIDKFGIVKAIQKAIDDSLNKLNLNEEEVFVSLDGGLRAPDKYINQMTTIKGDEIHPIISLASIVAKVSRDNVMCAFAKKYPMYGFDKHVGYGTTAHYRALQKHGPSPIHRKTFIH